MVGGGLGLSRASGLAELRVWFRAKGLVFSAWARGLELRGVR